MALAVQADAQEIIPPDQCVTGTLSVAFASPRVNGSIDGRCRIDRKTIRRCRSPLQLTLARGRHVFSVWSTDRQGRAGKPARFGFRVVGKR